MVSRYTATGAEAEFEPGSHRRVLRNLVGIRSVREMHEAESTALLAAQEDLIKRISVDQTFTADDVRGIHRTWLRKIYSWAGEYRSVNISKGDVQFAAAREIPRLMRDFERRELARFTPCRSGNPAETERALAIVHSELVIIHPFREGNGRCARLLTLLMALQAGLPPLDFGGFAGRGRPGYFAAVQAAVGSDYDPMTMIFRKAIERTLRRTKRGGR